MKVITLLCIVILGVGLMSCKEDIVGTDIDINFQLWVRDTDSKNLLDSLTPNHFSESKIRIYYIEDGQKVEVHDPTLDYPRNFFWYKHDYNGEELMRVFADRGRSSTTETTTLLIQWRENEVDTVETLIRKVNSSRYCDKITYNGVVMFDATKNALDTEWDGLYIRRLLEIAKYE